MLFTFAHEAAGERDHPAFPAPSAFWGERYPKLGPIRPRGRCLLACVFEEYSIGEIERENHFEVVLPESHTRNRAIKSWNFSLK